MLPKLCTLSGLLPDGHLSASGRVYEGTIGGSRVRIQRVVMYAEGDPHKFKDVRSRRHIFFVPNRQQNP